MKENKSYFKSQKGITLIALIITIILMFVLARITVSATIGPDGIIARAKENAHKAEIKEMYEIIGTHFESFNLSDEIIGKEGKEIFDLFKTNFSREVEPVEIVFSNKHCAVIKTENTGYFTILEDGTVYEGIKNLWLDIEDGNIILKENAFLQTKKSIYRTDDPRQSRWFSRDIVIDKENVTLKIENEEINSYIISGKSYKDVTKELNGEYVVLIYGKGNYNIKIKDLEITGSTDSRGANGTSIPFMANGMAGGAETGLHVNLILEGNNKLIGGSGACGLAFTGAKPNINGETEGSTLTISGNGTLYAKGAYLCPGIGTGYGYPPWQSSGTSGQGNNVNNIIINSGIITAEDGGSAPTIGSEHSAQLDKKVNNIIINGGIINTKSSSTTGIGIGADGVIGRVEINGGVINALKGEAIGHTSDGLGELVITGGIINDVNKNSIIGDDFGTIIIEGGTINCKKIGNENTNEIQILGGSIIMDPETGVFNIPPTNGKENVYLTKLSGMPKDSKIDKIEITGLSYYYGSKDLKTDKTEETDEYGNLYLYLPQGTRDITVTIRGVTYPFLNTVTN